MNFVALWHIVNISAPFPSLLSSKHSRRFASRRASMIEFAERKYFVKRCIAFGGIGWKGCLNDVFSFDIIYPHHYWSLFDIWYTPKSISNPWTRPLQFFMPHWMNFSPFSNLNYWVVYRNQHLVSILLAWDKNSCSLTYLPPMCCVAITKYRKFTFCV